MGKITLREKLLSEGELNRNIMVSSNFIKEMEVYGFMNCKDRGNILSGSSLITELDGYGDVQINSSNYIIYSFFMRQNNVVTPIYHTIAVCSQDFDINVEELYIPAFFDITHYNNGSLITDKLYREIKSRYGTGKTVSNLEWEKAQWPSEYSLVDGKVMMHIKQGKIVFKDKYECIKSVEEETLVLCRYPQDETGEMKYMSFGLDQLFVVDKNLGTSKKQIIK